MILIHSIASLGALAASPAPQAPPQEPEAPPPSFVAHVDLRGLVDLLGEETLRGVLRSGDGERREERRPASPDLLEYLAEEWGLDPLRTFLSFTLEGGGERRGPTLSIVATADVDPFLDELRSRRILRAAREGALEVEWLSLVELSRLLGEEPAEDDSEEVALLERPLGEGHRALVLAQHAESLLPAALAAAQAPRDPAGRPTLLPREAPPGSLVYVEVARSLEEFMARTPASRIGSKVRGGVLALTQASGRVALELSLDTDSPRDASDVAAILNGLRALMALAEEEDLPRPLAHILRDAEAVAAGGRVTVRLSASIAELREAASAR